MQAWVSNPLLALRPESEWPKQVPQARINSTKDEWYNLCKLLYERGIIESIDYNNIFHVGDQAVLNGAFAVAKKGEPLPGETRITRLIMNLIPSNSYQRLMTGDLRTLSSSTNWTSIGIKDNEVLLWSGDDQKGAFYAWLLPPAWRKFMAFRWPVPGHLVGSSLEWTYVAARVIAKCCLALPTSPQAGGNDATSSWCWP